jgi:hypothetical protein
MRFIEREVFQSVEETGVRVEPEVADCVTIEIVVPGEQILGDRR